MNHWWGGGASEFGLFRLVRRSDCMSWSDQSLSGCLTNLPASHTVWTRPCMTLAARTLTNCLCGSVLLEFLHLDCIGLRSGLGVGWGGRAYDKEEEKERKAHVTSSSCRMSRDVHDVITSNDSQKGDACMLGHESKSSSLDSMCWWGTLMLAHVIKRTRPGCCRQWELSEISSRPHVCVCVWTCGWRWLLKTMTEIWLCSVGVGTLWVCFWSREVMHGRSCFHR